MSSMKHIICVLDSEKMAVDYNNKKKIMDVDEIITKASPLFQNVVRQDEFLSFCDVQNGTCVMHYVETIKHNAALENCDGNDAVH